MRTHAELSTARRQAGASTVRIEHDVLGEHPVPAAALDGIHTARALANFDITGDTLARHPLLIEAIAAAMRVLTERCVVGITAKGEHLARRARETVVTVTHLSPVLGYARAGELATEVVAAGGGVLDLALSKGLLDEVQARQIEDAAIAQTTGVRRQATRAEVPAR